MKARHSAIETQNSRLASLCVENDEAKVLRYQKVLAGAESFITDWTRSAEEELQGAAEWVSLMSDEWLPAGEAALQAVAAVVQEQTLVLKNLELECQKGQEEVDAEWKNTGDR